MKTLIITALLLIGISAKGQQKDNIQLGDNMPNTVIQLRLKPLPLIQNTDVIRIVDSVIALTDTIHYRDSIAKYRELTTAYQQQFGMMDSRTRYFRKLLVKYTPVVAVKPPDSSAWIKKRKALSLKYKTKLP